MFSQSLEKNHVPILIPQSHQQSDVPPINRLPSEIIEYIFSLSADEDALFQYKNQLYLSWVCQSWRRIIISNALLWTTIDFRGNPELVATVVRRSGKARLVVELWNEAFDYPEKLALLSSTLISEAHRIETIQAILSSLNLQLIADDVLRHSFPSLRHLAFCGDLHDEIPLIDSQIPFTLDVNNLETFEIYDSSQVSWACLRSVISKVWKLDIRFEWEETVLDFFAEIQSFNQLKVLVMRFESTCDIPQLPTIILPNIATLVVEGDSVSSVANCLRIPNVQHLAIYNEIGFNFSFHPDFDYNSIEHVSITNCWSTSFAFHIVGSTKKDSGMIPIDNLGREEVKRFHLKAHFNQEPAGYHGSLYVLNGLLPRMPRVREISLPHRLPDHVVLPMMETPQSLSELIINYASLSSLRLIRSTPDTHVFGR